MVTRSAATVSGPSPNTALVAGAISVVRASSCRFRVRASWSRARARAATERSDAFGGLDRVGEVGEVGAQPQAGVDELGGGQAAQLAAERFRCGHQQPDQGVRCSRLGFDGDVPGDSKHPDRLDRTGGQLGCAAGVAGQHRACGCFGVDWVALAALAQQPPVRAGDLEHLHLLLVEVAGQAGARRRSLRHRPG
jgi:hypothetical protein